MKQRSRQAMAGVRATHWLTLVSLAATACASRAGDVSLEVVRVDGDDRAPHVARVRVAEATTLVPLLNRVRDVPGGGYSVSSLDEVPLGPDGAFTIPRDSIVAFLPRAFDQDGRELYYDRVAFAIGVEGDAIGDEDNRVAPGYARTWHALHEGSVHVTLLDGAIRREFFIHVTP